MTPGIGDGSESIYEYTYILARYENGMYMYLHEFIHVDSLFLSSSVARKYNDYGPGCYMCTLHAPAPQKHEIDF